MSTGTLASGLSAGTAASRTGPMLSEDTIVIDSPLREEADI